MSKIGIIGCGFVGSAVKEVFSEAYDVFVYDKDPKKCVGVTSIEELSNEVACIFLCVPTPMSSDNSCDTSIIDSVLNELNCLEYSGYVIIKSTIPPGTTAEMQIRYPFLVLAFNPEFLTEKNAIEDYRTQKTITIGLTVSDEHSEYLYNLFRGAFLWANIRFTDSTTAEMMKYTVNTFLATKVIFANEMYRICKLFDIDYQELISLVTTDSRLGNSHWNVPGPDGDFGFGGHCFPKDIAALIYECELYGLQPELLSVVKNLNLNLYRKDKDWEKMIGRAVSE